MQDPATPPPVPPPVAEDILRPVAHMELKAVALMVFTLALIVGSALYLLYARGAFEPTQTLVLTADDSEGVVVGMDMTFSGFPIGRVRGMVGGTNIRAYSGMLQDDPLPDGAVRPVLRGDATAEIPQLMASARELLTNLNALTAQDSALGASMANVQALTERLN